MLDDIKKALLFLTIFFFSLSFPFLIVIGVQGSLRPSIGLGAAIIFSPVFFIYMLNKLHDLAIKSHCKKCGLRQKCHACGSLVLHYSRLKKCSTCGLPQSCSPES